MFVSLARLCVVYVVKEVASFPGARSINYTPAERKPLNLRRNWN